MTDFESFSAAVRQHAPPLAVVLGSGLGAVPHRFELIDEIAFTDVPGLTAPSVHGHSGKISLGICASRPVLVFRGRLHFYEGHSWDRVASPIRTIANLGVKNLLLTNAAGGIHDELNPGDLMLLSGHLFLQEPNTWKTNGGLQPSCYSTRLNNAILENESKRNRKLLSGIYAAVTGPCYETPTEIQAIRAMKADAVGMSTAFEADTATSLGIETAAISCITNKAAGLAGDTLNHAEVLANAHKPAERISEIVEDLLHNV